MEINILQMTSNFTDDFLRLECRYWLIGRCINYSHPLFYRVVPDNRAVGCSSQKYAEYFARVRSDVFKGVVISMIINDGYKQIYC